jgi:hypothetical protein
VTVCSSLMAVDFSWFNGAHRARCAMTFWRISPVRLR